MVFLASSAIMGLNHSTPGCACTPGVDASREEGTSPDSRQLFYLLPPPSRAGTAVRRFFNPCCDPYGE